MAQDEEHITIRILFWNIKKNESTYSLIGQAVDEYDVDVCVLAEAPINADFLLIDRLPQGYKFMPPGSDKLKVRYFYGPRISMKTVGDDTFNRGSMMKLTVDGKIDLNLVGCHLIDPINYSGNEKSDFAISFNKFIIDLEDKLNSCKTVVVGDFNMNPFEWGMSSPSAFNSVMCKSVAQRESCVRFSTVRRFFYNPMWYFFGHPDLMNGTIYREPYYWNLYDQILIRPELMDGFSHDNINIIQQIKSTPLLTPKGYIDNKISDHLPLITTLNI